MTVYDFTCPVCSSTMEVDDAVVPELLEVGCAICEAPVTQAAFEKN